MKMYVAYGSNLDEKIMSKRCADSELVGSGRLSGWRLMFKGDLPYSYATVEEWEGYEVPVLLWTVSDEDERFLDMVEGYPEVYQKLNVEVEVEGKKVTGFMYVKPDSERLNPPSDHYYAVLYDAYKKLGFDLSILTEALRFSDVIIGARIERRQ